MNEIERYNIQSIDITELPVIISDQVNKIKELEVFMKKAIDSAKNSKNSAESANKKIGWFNRGTKEAVEQLQSSSKDLANAIQNGAEALQYSFEFQKDLANISKYLFGLGAMSMAQNRIVVRELELKMKNASEEDISELAKQELINVIIQLKAQEDILHKQQEFNSKLRDLDQELKIFSNTINNLEEKLKKQDEKYSEFKKSIGICEERINLLEEIIELYNSNFLDIKISCDKQNIEINDLKNDIEKCNHKIYFIEKKNNKMKIIILIFTILILVSQVINYFL